MKSGSKTLIFSLVIIIFSFFQATVLNSIKIFGVKPDLLIISVIIGSVFWEWKSALFFSLLAGASKDIFGAGAFAFNLLLFPLWSYLIFKLSRKLTLDYDFALIILVFAVVFLNDVIIRIIFLFFDTFVGFWVFLRIAFIESLYTALFLPLVLKTLDFLRCPVQYK